LGVKTFPPGEARASAKSMLEFYELRSVELRKHLTDNQFALTQTQKALIERQLSEYSREIGIIKLLDRCSK
jgi:hypothetical protein